MTLAVTAPYVHSLTSFALSNFTVLYVHYKFTVFNCVELPLLTEEEGEDQVGVGEWVNT